MMELSIPEGKKIYFASDLHLGAGSHENARAREDKVVRWLESIEKDVSHLFLVGDIFDFWFEYKKVIPKGFIRFQGKIASMCDRGIPVYFFTGNHDMWLFDYFTKELGIQIFRKPSPFKLGEKRFHIGHGDGLGHGDYVYKVLKRFFANPLCQWMFGFLHPRIGMGIAHAWSAHSKRKAAKKGEDFFRGDDEWIWQYCKEQEAKQHFDYYVFGHRHLPLKLEVGKQGAIYYNLGEWMKFCSYASFDGTNFDLLSFENTHPL